MKRRGLFGFKILTLVKWPVALEMDALWFVASSAFIGRAVKRHCQAMLEFKAYGGAAHFDASREAQKLCAVPTGESTHAVLANPKNVRTYLRKRSLITISVWQRAWDDQVDFKSLNVSVNSCQRWMAMKEIRYFLRRPFGKMKVNNILSNVNFVWLSIWPGKLYGRVSGLKKLATEQNRAVHEFSEQGCRLAPRGEGRLEARGPGEARSLSPMTCSRAHSKYFLTETSTSMRPFFTSMLPFFTLSFFFMVKKDIFSQVISDRQ